MRFLRRPRSSSRCIAVFCGAFHPPTVAHAELARAAREQVDEVLWVMPETFPHKKYEGVDLNGRLRMILEATADPVAVARENLFFSIASETRAALANTEVQLLIGEDGARRVVEWDYGLSPEQHRCYLNEQLAQFPILTARRQADWELPRDLEPWFRWLEVDPEMSIVSSTLVRTRIEQGEPWQSLVPGKIRRLVEMYYSSPGTTKGQ